MAKTERNWLHRCIPRKENQPILGVYMNVCVSVCMHVATCVGMALACVCEKRRRSDYGSECGKEMDPQQWGGGGTQTDKDRFGTM